MKNTLLIIVAVMFFPITLLLFGFYMEKCMNALEQLETTHEDLRY